MRACNESPPTSLVFYNTQNDKGEEREGGGGGGGGHTGFFVEGSPVFGKSDSTCLNSIGCSGLCV